MNYSQQKPNTEKILAGLKDFQRDTVDYVFRRLYLDDDAVRRFLVADEVGLGKTLVARGVVARAIEHIWDTVDRIDIVYICANRDIARQNVNRLNVTREREIAIATRMTLLPMHLHDLQEHKLNFVSFTPGTSFNLRSATGVAYERALVYHILRDGWNLGNAAGPKNLLQCGAGKETWRKRLDRFPVDEIDQDLAAAFMKALGKKRLRYRFNRLCDRFSYHRQNVPDDDRKDRNALIGELRSTLAESCVNSLEPDIVILDEFQRFKHLLDGDDEVARLAKAVFDYGDAKVLLLSATPYKMYTMYHEQDTDDHYTDFIRTTGFLFASEEQTGAFKQDLAEYCRALIDVRSSDGQQLHDARQVIEKKLRKVMVRTERLAATADRSGMIVEAKKEAGTLMPVDLRAFAALDRVARHLGVGDTIEYWKSAPYLLNVMDRTGYKIKEKLVEEVEEYENPALAVALADAREGLLSWKAIRAYEPIDPLNAKLRTLQAAKLDSGAWKLLWVPASLPYYQVHHGPYSEPGLQGFTKSLVFSSWLVVPKAIAMLTSYEAERQMVCALDDQDDERDYTKERRRRRPLLRFSFEKLEGNTKKRATGMSAFLLLYPCMTLAARIDPMVVAVKAATEGELPDVDTVRAVVRKQLEEFLAPILDRYAGTGGAVDESWYWAALAALDRRYFSRPVRRWLETEDEDLAWAGMVRQADDADTNFSDHVDIFTTHFNRPVRLGRPPDDLVDVLTKCALASPAVVALRSLLRLYPRMDVKGSSGWLLASAAEIAMGFRTLFNLPESMTLIRSLRPAEDSRYWESVLDYSVVGNLQSVMDEYVHILREALGLIDAEPEDVFWQVGEEIATAVSIRTVNLDFDEIRVAPSRKTARLGRHSIRCRFALRFGDGRSEEEGMETRADQVRCAFNSPFRPFILATTSIGQEGLDFHQYCHEIYHWNLPSNPVDLEQREGRIQRYKGHVIRRNVAQKHPLAHLADRVDHLSDPWGVIFELARQDRGGGKSDLVPFWIFELADGHNVDRHILALPLSRDREQLANLRRTIVAYRMVLGQPRQEDLVRYLEDRLGVDIKPEDLLKYRIDLTPAP